MNFAELVSDTIEISFVYKNKRGKESSITMNVYEEFLTASFLSNIKKAEETDDALFIAEALAEAIESWDLFFKKPNSEEIDFKPSVAVLSKCPLSFLKAALEAMISTVEGDKKKSNE